MNTIIIKVGAVTHAIKLKRLLSRAGIEAKQVKNLDSDGCNHGIEIDHRDYYSTIAILKENKFIYSIVNKNQ